VLPRESNSEFSIFETGFLARNIKRTYVIIYSVWYSSPIVTKPEFFRDVVTNLLDTKFHENTSRGVELFSADGRVDGRTEGHGKANSLFSQLWKRVYLKEAKLIIADTSGRRVLRRGPKAGHLLGLWLRIPPWMSVACVWVLLFVSTVLCVGLITLPQES
jgi:hypothetical protein